MLILRRGLYTLPDIVNDEGLTEFIIISDIISRHEWEDFFQVYYKNPNFRHKAQFGHYQGTKYTLINSTNEL